MKLLNIRLKYFKIRHEKILVLVLLLVFLSLQSGCSSSKLPSTAPYLAEDRDTQWINDLTYLEKTLPQVHKNLFFHLSEEEFHRQLDELKQKVPENTDQQIEIALKVIMAGIGDTHTGSSVSAEYRYPLELHWFAEGIYITGTSKEYKDILDAQIITINGEKIEEAANMLKPVLGEANESWFRNQVVYYLPVPGILQHFGLSTSDEIELGVQLINGEEKKVIMKPVSYKEYKAAEKPDKPVPLYQSHPDEYYWYEYIQDEKTIYFNYNRCREMKDKSFNTFAKEFWDFVQSHEVNKLVLDIRQNGGGSSPILEPWIKEVKESSFNQPGKLYVIIGRNTFSSAILNALRLKRETNAYFVGEPTGGEPNHYGEVRQFKLPNSQRSIRYSTKYFHWVDEDVNTLKPDKVIEETFAAYRKGNDPVLTWILNNTQRHILSIEKYN